MFILRRFAAFEGALYSYIKRLAGAPSSWPSFLALASGSGGYSWAASPILLTFTCAHHTPPLHWDSTSTSSWSSHEECRSDRRVNYPSAPQSCSDALSSSVLPVPCSTIICRRQRTVFCALCGPLSALSVWCGFFPFLATSQRAPAKFWALAAGTSCLNRLAAKACPWPTPWARNRAVRKPAYRLRFVVVDYVN
ncbi:hypothetical protein PYCCODRAFT_1279865 [Trametes coccinea BRFM310]|uniref:Uncharacterized protein n=1 Tax=Trametes coccinea (strain BRFM310) TaxID=1353009 RepID=A0A1Y2IVC8_TRAC3|nr:hypothetical protein PYCCODRAFT_1279865 [Trametes coccinea BRFM310]